MTKIILSDLDKQLIQEGAKLKALKKILTFKKINFRNKLKILSDKLRSKKITKQQYIKLKNEIKKSYDKAIISPQMNLLYQLDPAHTGQTIQKFSSIFY